MAQLNVPAQAAISQTKVDALYGCDLTSSGANVNMHRSPDCPNMVRESIGKVKKRPGYKTRKIYSGRINGVFRYKNGAEELQIVHAGTSIYIDAGTDSVDDDTLLYSEAKDDFSQAAQLNEMLVICDGHKMLLFGKHSGDSYSIVTAESKAYVPTIVISRDPKDGGGTTYEPVNLLGTGRKDSFLGVADVNEYQLSSGDLLATKVTAKTLQADGSWEELAEGTDFTVNRTTGLVTFNAAHPAVKTGEDNVVITYHVAVDGYADRINKCNICMLYGANGARNRIFLAGNPEFENHDWYCRQDDPTYWGDLWYSVIGQDGATIMGYSIVNEKLVTTLNGSDDDMNFVLRAPSEDGDGNTVFTLAGAYQGTGAISKNSFAVLKTEPVFLSDLGIFAVTPSDVIGERYAQERSYYLRGKLETLDLTDAYGKAVGDFYYLAVGEYLFLLDGLQPAADENQPYSNRQYEAYYWTDINARILYDDGRLCFGTDDGRLCEFATDYDSLQSYNDDGRAIDAKWTTPEIYGKNFHYKKKFRRVSVLLAPAIATGCRIYAHYDGITELISDYTGDARYFSFSSLVFSKFTFKTSTAPQQMRERMSIKPDDRSLVLSFENDVMDEPFGIYGIAVEFTETRG